MAKKILTPQEKLEKAKQQSKETSDLWCQYAQHIADELGKCSDADEGVQKKVFQLIANLPPASRVVQDRIEAIYAVKLSQQQVWIEELDKLDRDTQREAAQELVDKIRKLDERPIIFTFTYP